MADHRRPGAALRDPRTVRTPAPELICLSHREPFAPRRIGAAERLERTTGGLVTALDAALRELGGTWIASGTTDTRIDAPDDGTGRQYTVEQLAIPQRTLDAYYSGFSNGVLWPLFHYFIGRVEFDPEQWGEYQKVNRRFAQALGRALERKRRPVAWVHDYHLMSVPKMVRRQVPDATVGFFLHIPFPAWEVFRILPPRRELLEGVLGADLVGFHTPSYQEAFLDCCRRLLGARIDRDGTVEHDGHRTRTIAHPIGIDVARQEELAVDVRTTSKAQRLRKAIVGDKLLLGVDRLDYSKGILERLHGFERLLQRHPEHRGNVTLVQIAVPSRTRVPEYQQLKRDVDEAVGRINGNYGDAIWMPVHYVARGFTAEELSAYYRAADVCLVTPLRDGLNLVAKEYVATRTDLGGALVLSEFAGAAEELPEAYTVNPFDCDAIASALHAALTDDRLERERRMTAMRAQVHRSEVHGWARTFVSRLSDGR